MSEVVFKQSQLASAGGRKVKFIASDESEDRMGDVIRASGWELRDFKKNPVLLWGHNSGEPPIGLVDRIYVSGKQLIAEASFLEKSVNPFADSIFEMVKAGVVRAVSVGFLPTKKPNMREDKDGRFLGYEFIKQSLLELSVVSVPANPNAVAFAKQLRLSPREMKRLFSEPVIPDSLRNRKRELDLIKLLN